MVEFERITDGIFRLCVPFESIYTAVFLIKTDFGDILVDAATTKYDAEEIIYPAICKATLPDNIKYIFCTHLHGDHGGGIRYLLPLLKNARVAAASARAIELYGEEKVHTVHDGDSLFGINVISLKGHSADSMGLFDTRTSTVLLGDGIQLCGIMKYGTGVEFPNDYKNMLARLRKMDIKMLVASHEYYPLGSVAEGDGVAEYIDFAESAYKAIEDFVAMHRGEDSVKIAAEYTSLTREKDPDMTTLQSYTVRALLTHSVSPMKISCGTVQPLPLH